MKFSVLLAAAFVALPVRRVVSTLLEAVFVASAVTPRRVIGLSSVMVWVVRSTFVTLPSRRSVGAARSVASYQGITEMSSPTAISEKVSPSRSTVRSCSVQESGAWVVVKTHSTGSTMLADATEVSRVIVRPGLFTAVT
ncbi:MAG: hypothetical protein BWY76_03302 [bacterium ADurb.Bin429]|nr:MAG: hypothetical protein BWY76_03302 [bacterium ADurb.Bin429]